MFSTSKFTASLLGLALLLAGGAQAHNGIIHLKIPKRMAIQPPTTVQDNSLRTGDVSAIDIQQNVSYLSSVAPNTETTVLNTSFTIPNGPSLTILIKGSAQLGWTDNANLNTRMIGSLNIVIDSITVSQSNLIRNFSKAIATDFWNLNDSVAVFYSASYAPGTYTLELIARNSTLSLNNMSVGNVYLEVLKLKA